MTQKKVPRISDEERTLFQKAISDIKPLKSHYRNLTEKPDKKYVPTKKPDHSSERKIIFDFHDKQPDTHGEDIISFSHTSVQYKRLSQLRQGKMHAEATLDLHKHTIDEAIHVTDDFLIHCQNRGFRTVCIIHGKGHYSADNKPVIKNLLNNYLRSHPAVLAFHSAKSKHGGAGALYVLLRVKS